MSNPLDHLAADVERVFEEHRPEIESAFGVAETAAVALDPQLAALVPLFGELTDEGKRLVADTLHAIHGSGILRAAPATPDPTATVPADASSPASAEPSAAVSGLSEPPLQVGPPVA